MLGDIETKAIDRVIDANINRLKEGLRVCEEVARFIIGKRALTLRLKRLRHELDGLILRLIPLNKRLAARASLSDIGYRLSLNEAKRGGLKSIYLANIQRAKEALRVLEEFSKLKNKKAAAGFKRLRYILYDIEKRFPYDAISLCKK